MTPRHPDVRDGPEKLCMCLHYLLGLLGVCMQTVTLQALEAVSNRLRDKKLPVRKEAALQLAAVFRFA